MKSKLKAAAKKAAKLPVQAAKRAYKKVAKQAGRAKRALKAGVKAFKEAWQMDTHTVKAGKDKGKKQLSVALGLKDDRSGLFTPVVEKGTVLPTSKTVQGWTNLEAQQTFITFHVYQEDVALPQNLLGEIDVAIEPGPAESANIDVIFNVIESGAFA